LRLWKFPERLEKIFSAASHNKLAKAEQHLRKALDEDAQYPAAWVLLGQVLKAQQKPDDARDACSQALKVDPGYVLADLCLADLYVVQQRWEEMPLRQQCGCSRPG
jgi:cytochrome c-type biogenesis protein CcmH/NrfG